MGVIFFCLMIAKIMQFCFASLTLNDFLSKFYVTKDNSVILKKLLPFTDVSLIDLRK